MSPENKNISNEKMNGMKLHINGNIIKMTASNKSSNVRRNYNEVWKGVAGLSPDLQNMINKMTIVNYTKKVADDDLLCNNNNDCMDGRLLKHIDTQNGNVIYDKLLPQVYQLDSHKQIMKKNRRKYNKKLKKEMNKHSHTTIETDTDLHMFVPEDVDISKTETMMNIHNAYSTLETDIEENISTIITTIRKIYLLPYLNKNTETLLDMMDKNADLEIKICGNKSLKIQKNLEDYDFKNSQLLLNSTIDNIFKIQKEEMKKYIGMCRYIPYGKDKLTDKQMKMVCDYCRKERKKLCNYNH